MVEPATPAVPDAELDAYSLLSKPTLDLSPAEVTRIVEDLRARRKRHIASGKPDKPVKKVALTAEKATPEQKRQATADLLSSLGGIKLGSLKL